jgi:hypothetical protein
MDNTFYADRNSDRRTDAVRCGGTAQKRRKQSAKHCAGEKEAADETLSSGPYWLIETSDTKNFTYTIPNSNGGVIDMTATLYFIAWKTGGRICSANTRDGRW